MWNGHKPWHVARARIWNRHPHKHRTYLKVFSAKHLILYTFISCPHPLPTNWPKSYTHTMDKSKSNSPRKQKQLGPAPIASFERSFEDTSSDELKLKVNCPWSQTYEYCIVVRKRRQRKHHMNKKRAERKKKWHPTLESIFELLREMVFVRMNSHEVFEGVYGFRCKHVHISIQNYTSFTM